MPFIEIEVINSIEAPKSLLRVIKAKFDKIVDGTVQWRGSENKPKLVIQFETKDDFFQTYNKDINIYECCLNLIAEKSINIEKIPVNLRELPDDDLYATLKYVTDFKDPIRKKYYYIFKILNILVIQISYEEVEDGFLLFYRGPEDFTIGQMNIFELPQVKQWLEEHNIWKEIYSRCWDPHF